MIGLRLGDGRGDLCLSRMRVVTSVRNGWDGGESCKVGGGSGIDGRAGLRY